MADAGPNFDFHKFEASTFSVQSETNVASFNINGADCKILKFTREDEAKLFHAKLMNNRVPRLGLPLPIVEVEGNPPYFIVAIRKAGIDLSTVLLDPHRMQSFYDILQMDSTHYRVQVSDGYRNMIRSLMEVVFFLNRDEMLYKDDRLGCSFCTDSVSLFEDPVTGVSDFVISVSGLRERQVGDYQKQWSDLATLIRTINGADFSDGRRLEALPTVEMDQVLSCLSDGSAL